MCVCGVCVGAWCVCVCVCVCPDDVLQYTALSLKMIRQRRNTQERLNSKSEHKSVPCWLYCFIKT